MSAIDTLVSASERYAFPGALPARPARQVAVVACMDARLDVFGLLGLAEGDAHVIRNAGGVVTEDVIRSLVISQRLLGTREIMLIHHTQCGLLDLQEDALKAQIEAETDVRPAFGLAGFADLEEDVRQSIARIRASPFLPHTQRVRGFVYDVETGKLRELSA
jgi:carbonic anhydrase